MKKRLSFILALAMIASLALVAAPAALASADYEASGGNTIANIQDFSDVQAHFGIAEFTPETATTMTSGNDAATTTSNIVIDFDAETIAWDGAVPAEAPAFVSFDNGGKWSALKFSIGETAEPADFSKFLNKESTIKLTTALDKATKQPQKAVAEKKDSDGNVTTEAVAPAVTWTFGKFDARPKLDKFSLDYASLNKTNFTADGLWTLKAAGSQKLGALQVAYSADKGKNVVGEYGVFPASGGLNVVPSDTKPGEKLTFMVRVAPTAKSAGSKAKKYGVSTLIKAPTLKMDYKKNLLKMKADMVIGEASVSRNADNEVTSFTSGFDLIAKATTKESKEVKPGLTLIPEADAVDYAVRSVATEKKPASEPQLITVAAMSEINETMVEPTIKGTSIKLAKAYELAPWGDRAKADTKWKGSAKADKSGTYAVRVKNTAKYDAKSNGTTGNPVSGNLILDVVVGTDANGKAAVTAWTWLAKKGDDPKDATASNIDAAVYFNSAKDAVQTISLTENKTTADVKVLASTYTVKGQPSYKISGSSSVLVSSVDSASAVAFTAANTAQDIAVIASGAEAKADGTIEINFEKPAGAETFFAPTVKINVTKYKEPAASSAPPASQAPASRSVTVNATGSTTGTTLTANPTSFTTPPATIVITSNNTNGFAAASAVTLTVGGNAVARNAGWTGAASDVGGVGYSNTYTITITDASLFNGDVEITATLTDLS